MIKWHPTKSSIASTTNQGSILIWHFPNPERWGAFAGGFEEVDENVEYEEREDEFDIVSFLHNYYYSHLDLPDLFELLKGRRTGAATTKNES